jgi:hypothetical protein
MSQQQINEAISSAFSNLAELSSQVYDYWISELYIGYEMLDEMWSEDTLHLMEQDVLMLSDK